ncbi:MAG TPA: ABC transporter permease, partial [Fimbriimonadaceae bacterium]|nr:ABC transporter permease [Fimbriimonadaceae bacterium]
GILWGLIAVVNTFALAMVKERTMGTFQRLAIAPISPRQLLAGKGLACFLVSFFVTLGLLVFGTIVGVRTFSNPAALALALICTAVCFVGLMMLISTFGKTENSVSGAGWGMMLVFSMIGGGMIPLIAMPQWMQAVSSASPVKWSITALEGAIWRGFTLSEMALPCAVLLGVGAAGYGLGTMLLSRQKA